MSNSYSLTGRIGSDPELKDVGATKVLEFSFATDTGFGDKKITSWINAKIWGKRAESLSNHLEKGKQLFLVGELTLRPYEGKNGKGISPDLNVNVCDFIGGKGEAKAEESEDTPF